MNWNGILSETVRDRYREPPLFAAGFTGLSLIALVLALIGIYGVVAGAVARRSREMGIRLSLGARPGELVTLVLRQSTGTALAGLILGTLTAFALMRLAAGILYGVRPDDPLVYLAGGLVMALATLTAALVPALRIIRIDPVTAIRVE
jgi:ABC-type antimicrobial peptide transport system permease subunit